MNRRQQAFLRAVVGASGAEALTKAAGDSPDLAWAVLPRVASAWLEVVARDRFEGTVPGTTTSLSLKKTEQGYSGSVELSGTPYSFVDASSYHVAAALALAVGVRPGSSSSQPALIGKLGKSVDLLVRAKLISQLRKAAPPHKGGAKGSEPGATAAPLAPQEPLAPEPTQEEQGEPVGTKMGTTSKVSQKSPEARPRVKLPSVKKKPTMKVTKAEATRPCYQCGRLLFDLDDFVGCSCLESLAKSVKVTAYEQNYVLEFGPEWDVDGILILAELLGK